MRGRVVLLVALFLVGCLEAPGDDNEVSDEGPAVPAPSTAVATASLDARQYVAALHDSGGRQQVLLVVHEAPGYGLIDAALDGIAAELSRAIQKEVRWERRVLDADGGRDTRWSGSQLGDLAQRITSDAWPADTVPMHAASLPGCYKTSDRDCVGGVEVANVGFVFLDEKRTTDLPPESRPLPYVGEVNIQRYIVLHELGHSMGLVDREVTAVATWRISNDSCRCHSTNQESVMYGRGSINLTGGGEKAIEEIFKLASDRRWNDQYDEDDIADLRAFQATLAAR